MSAALKNQSIPINQVVKMKEKFAQIALQYKRTIDQLKRELDLQKTSSSGSSAHLIQKLSEMEVQLRAETLKSESLTKKLKEQSDGTLDVDAIKNAAIAAAQNETLKLELDEVNGRYEKLKAETKNKITQLQDGLKEEMTKSSKITAQFKEKLAILEEERSKYSSSKEYLEKADQTIKEFEVTVAENRTEISSLKSEVEALTQKLAEEKENFLNEMKTRDDQMLKFKQELEEQKIEIERLLFITRTFDLIKIEEKVDEMKIQSLEVSSRGSQAKLRSTLSEVLSITNMAQTYDKKSQVKIANFFHELFEMECRLKNKIVDE